MMNQAAPQHKEPALTDRTVLDAVTAAACRDATAAGCTVSHCDTWTITWPTPARMAGGSNERVPTEGICVVVTDETTRQARCYSDGTDVDGIPTAIYHYTLDLTVPAEAAAATKRWLPTAAELRRHRANTTGTS